MDKLRFAPCLPVDWPGFTMHYRYRNTVYHIAVSQTHDAEGEQIGEIRVTVDGVLQADQSIPLVDDRQAHAVEVKVHVLPGMR